MKFYNDFIRIIQQFLNYKDNIKFSLSNIYIYKITKEMLLYHNKAYKIQKTWNIFLNKVVSVPCFCAIKNSKTWTKDQNTNNQRYYDLCVKHDDICYLKDRTKYKGEIHYCYSIEHCNNRWDKYFQLQWACSPITNRDLILKNTFDYLMNNNEYSDHMDDHITNIFMKRVKYN